MTSPVSSMKASKAKPYHPWMRSFRQAMREGMAPTVVNIALFMAAIAGTALVLLFQKLRFNEPAYLSMRYCFASAMALNMLPVLVLESALAQGLMAFRFLFSRKSSNAWFSLGISRNTLFWSRFAAGAAGALLPVVLAMTVSLGINLSLFSDTCLILDRFAFLLCGMCVQALLLYCVTVAACSMTATIVEGAAYPFLLAAMPTVVIMVINALMMKFLFGNGYGISEDMYYNFNTTLVKALSDLNPLIFMNPYFDRYSGESLAASPEYLASLPPLPINWVLILGWLAVSLALLWLSFRMFVRRKAEYAGVLGTGKAVAFISVLTVAFFAFSIVFLFPLHMTQKLPSAAMLCIAGALAATAMLAMAIPLKLIVRPYWKSILPLVSGLAAMYAVVGILSAGGLGFSGRVPDEGDARSVTVSYHGMPMYLEHGNSGSTGGLFGNMDSQQQVALTDPKDIAVVTELHSMFAEAGRLEIPEGKAFSERTVYSMITSFTYTMNDGSVTRRSYFGITRDMMKDMLALDDTAGVKKAFADYILAEKRKYGHDSAYMHGSVFLWTPFYGQCAPVSLNDAERRELLACIADDIAAQKVEDRYFPAEPEICMLMFTMETGPEAGNPSDSGIVYVMPGFTRTLAFLEGKNLTGVLRQTSEIEYLGVVDYDRTQDYTIIYNGYDISFTFPNFVSGTVRGTADRYRDAGLEIPIDDPAQRQEILSRCHGFYLTCDGGYLVVIKYKGEDRLASAFLPIKDAPDFVKKAAK